MRSGLDCVADTLIRRSWPVICIAIAEGAAILVERAVGRPGLSSTNSHMPVDLYQRHAAKWEAQSNTLD
jgi:hypothetical protein